MAPTSLTSAARHRQFHDAALHSVLSGEEQF